VSSCRSASSQGAVSGRCIEAIWDPILLPGTGW